MPSVTISGIIPAQLAPAEKALPISRSEKRLNHNPLQENLQNVFKPVRISEGVQEPTSHKHNTFYLYKLCGAGVEWQGANGRWYEDCYSWAVKTDCGVEIPRALRPPMMRCNGQAKN